MGGGDSGGRALGTTFSVRFLFLRFGFFPMRLHFKHETT